MYINIIILVYSYFINIIFIWHYRKVDPWFFFIHTIIFLSQEKSLPEPILSTRDDECSFLLFSKIYLLSSQPIQADYDDKDEDNEIKNLVTVLI